MSTVFARAWFLFSVLWAVACLWGAWDVLNALWVVIALGPFIVRLVVRWVAAGYWIRH